MKRTVLLFAVSLIAASVYASDFRDIKISEIKSSRIELPAPALAANAPAKCGHVAGEITKLHLLPSANQSQLVSSADTPELFKEFVHFWTPILEKFGMEVTGSEYLGSIGTLKYKSVDGSVMRVFTANKLHYDATSLSAITNLQHQLLGPLERAGMRPIASFNIKNDAFRPTFNIYYLTKPETNPAGETQLRQLMKGENIDYDLMESAGVNIVRKDADFSMVYIGKEILHVSKMADTENAINKKVTDYLKFLEEGKKELIGYRVRTITPVTVGDITYNYLANIYSYR
jgi:hypothetical protein